MRPLGQLLVERGWIDPSQLEDALARKQHLGGRLGTALLETGAMEEDLLLRVLSEQLGVPAADIEDLRGLPGDIPAMLPADLAIRSEAVPFRVVTGRVDVALLDTHNLALQDELSFVIGKRIKVHIANEARVYEALQAYYGKECSVRVAHLLDRLNRARDRWRKARKTGAVPQPSRPVATRHPPAPAPLPATAEAPGGVEPSAAAAAPPPAARTSPKRPLSVPLSEIERRALRGQESGASSGAETLRRLTTPPAEEKPPATEAPSIEPAPHDEGTSALLERFQKKLATTESSREVAELLMEALSDQFVRILLFQVSRRRFSGWIGHGPGVATAAGLQDLSLPLDHSSIFQRVAESGRIFRGRMDDGPVHRRLLALWGGKPDTECLVCPVSIRDRLVTLVYGDRDALGLEGVDLGRVQQLTAHAAVALERCLVQRKLRRSKELH